MIVAKIKPYIPIRQSQNFGITYTSDAQRIDEYLKTLKQYKNQSNSVKEQINILEQMKFATAKKQFGLSTPFVSQYINITKKLLEMENHMNYLNSLLRELTNKEQQERTKILKDAEIFLARQEELKAKILN